MALPPGGWNFRRGCRRLASLEDPVGIGFALQPVAAEASHVQIDIVGGEHVGWPAIREFFAHGLVRWPDLSLIPDEYWTNDAGVAVRWVMSATVSDPVPFGAAAVGRKWRSEGMR